MAIDGHERYARREVEAVARALIEQDETPACDSIADIRQKALERFQKDLDAKLSNVQDGEYLTVIYRIDIVRSNGKVRGGRGYERNMPEYAEWRRSVFERDNWRCQECGSTRKLNAHHIKRWVSHPELRFDVNNGVTLCFDCHTKKHPHIGWTQAED
jgi:hypothetical protein